MSQDKARNALLRAFYEMYGDYVDEVWGRDLSYLADALRIDLTKLEQAAYNSTPSGRRPDIAEFISMFPNEERTMPTYKISAEAALRIVKSVLDEVPDHIAAELWVDENTILGAFVDMSLVDVFKMREADLCLLEALQAVASILPHYAMKGDTASDDEALDAVMETVSEAISRAEECS